VLFPAELIIIPAVLALAAVLWVGYNIASSRGEKDEASAADQPASVETIAESVASTAAETDEEAETTPDEGTPAEEEIDENAVLEPAHNNHMVLGSLEEEYSDIIASKMENLPPLPRATLNLLPMLSSPRTSARDIAQVISTDPLLAGKILRRVNSCFYALGSKVNSIQHAVALLGFDNIRAISLRESFDSMLDPEPVEELTANLLWRHSAAMSLFAKHLATRMRGVDPNLVGSAGLLHDIGLLVLMAIDRGGLSDALRLSVMERRPLCECEERLVGFNHQVLGGILSKKWNLSDELCSAIGRHHSPYIDDERVDPVPGIIWLAHSAASQFGYAHRPSACPPEDAKELAKKLGLRWPVTSYVTEGLLRELQKVLSLWEVLGLMKPDKQRTEKSYNAIEAE
jgi:HD-like signal output (HDOD) protein